MRRPSPLFPTPIATEAKPALYAERLPKAPAYRLFRQIRGLRRLFRTLSEYRPHSCRACGSLHCGFRGSTCAPADNRLCRRVRFYRRWNGSCRFCSIRPDPHGRVLPKRHPGTAENSRLKKSRYVRPIYATECCMRPWCKQCVHNPSRRTL